MSTGTYVIADLEANKAATVAEYGEDNVLEIVQRELEAHNANTASMMNTLAFTTQERLLRYGGGGGGDFEETDENARPRTQKGAVGQTLGMPLRRFQRAVGWNRDYFEVATLAEIQKELITIQTRDVQNIHRGVRAALFNPSNSTFFDEYGSPQVDLPVKALLNADGSMIPAGPNGEEFNGASHTHYLANASLTEAFVDSVVETVVEHGVTEGVEIYINRTNVGAFSALDAFLPAVGPLVRAGISADSALITAEANALDNTPVGVWDGRHVVHTKPWVPAGYIAVVASGQGEEARPLAMRIPTQAARQGLHLHGEIDLYPLRGNYFRRFFGVAAYNRHSAAVGQFTNATYQQPA